MQPIVTRAENPTAIIVPKQNLPENPLPLVLLCVVHKCWRECLCRRFGQHSHFCPLPHLATAATCPLSCSHMKLVDQMLVADEYRLWHLVFTQVYGVCYVVWTVVWYFSGPQRDRLIYDVLDWQGGTLAACLYSLATIAVLTCLLYTSPSPRD